MSKRKKASCKKSASNPFQYLTRKKLRRKLKGGEHIYGKHVRCKTDSLGYPTPGNRDPSRIVIDATPGVISLWAKGTTLNWRFQERSLRHLADPEAAKDKIRDLLGRAILAWGHGIPIGFHETGGLWDFEIAVKQFDDCDVNGCVLASAFFPDSGRHELAVYPRMFRQSRKEQIETIAHEIGHAFGLRHFFAKIDETAWPAEIFGTHRAFSIMNYGVKSVMTSNDRDDLKNLYEKAWSGRLTEINGTPIQLVRPFHSIVSATDRRKDFEGTERSCAASMPQDLTQGVCVPQVCSCSCCDS